MPLAEESLLKRHALLARCVACERGCLQANRCSGIYWNKKGVRQTNKDEEGERISGTQQVPITILGLQPSSRPNLPLSPPPHPICHTHRVHTNLPTTTVSSPPSDMSHPQSTHKSTKKRRPIRFVQVLRVKDAAISTSTKASNRQTTPRQLTRANSLLLNLYPCGLRSCCPAHSSQRTVLVRQSLIPLQKASFRCRSPSVL